MIGTLGRNRFQGFGDDIFDVVRDERQRIHGRHVDAAVPAVAVGHDVADAVAHFGGRIGHTGRHESREVGFDLEIEVVGVRIILPVPAFGCFHSVENIVTRRLIGMPQLVGGIGEGTGHRVDGHVESVLVVNLDEGQIHVDVVVQAGLVVVPPFDIVVGPRDLVLVGNDRPVVLEFGRTPVGAAESLSGPTALDLVQQHFSGQRYGIGRRAAATGRQQHDGRQRRKHRVFPVHFHIVVRFWLSVRFQQPFSRPHGPSRSGTTRGSTKTAISCPRSVAARKDNQPQPRDEEEEHHAQQRIDRAVGALELFPDEDAERPAPAHTISRHRPCRPRCS